MVKNCKRVASLVQSSSQTVILITGLVYNKVK